MLRRVVEHIRYGIDVEVFTDAVKAWGGFLLLLAYMIYYAETIDDRNRAWCRHQGGIPSVDGQVCWTVVVENKPKKPGRLKL